MPEIHTCDQVEVIAELKKEMQSIKEAIKGNGKEGLIVTVTKLAQSNTFLTHQISEASNVNSKLATAVNALLLFQKEMETKEALKEKYRSKQQHERELLDQEEHIENRFRFTKKHLVWTLVVSSGLGLSGLLISMITLLSNF